MSFKITPCSIPFSGTITVPGDKSISHRALILAALSRGISTIQNLSDGKDVTSTYQALEQLGVRIESLEPGKKRVYGRSRELTSPPNNIDCGNSGTTMRLLAGILSAQSFPSRLIGDASLSQRPMERIIAPLRQMGTVIQAEEKNGRPPLFVHGNKNLFSLHDYKLPVASAQLKSALLLAALFAQGTTTIIEPTPTRDHTERLFESFQIFFDEVKIGTSKKISLTGPQTPQACNLTIPGDISSAAFWIIAAAARRGSNITIKNVSLNPTRIGFLDVLRRMNRTSSHPLCALESGMKTNAMAPKYAISGTDPFGNIVVQGSLLAGITISGKEIPGLIDELPILAIAGALAEGTTIIRDAQELRVKETDRIGALVHNLRAMGVTVKEYDDGLEINGRSHLQGASLKSFGDHRIAMAFSIAALFATGESTIDDVSCIETSYPSFIPALEKIIRES